MSGPSWLADIFASVMLILAVYSVARLLAAWAWSRPTYVDTDVVHVLMGVAMAGMFVPSLNPVPARLWEVVFSVVAVWYLWRCAAHVTRRGEPTYPGDSAPGVPYCPAHHYPTHVVMAFAMLYMYVAAPTAAVNTTVGAMASGATGTTADYVELPLLFLLVLLGSGVWELDRASRLRRERLAQGSPAPVLQPTAPAVLVWALNTTRPAGAPEIVGTVPRIADATEDRPSPRPWLAPGLMAASHVAMCIAMGYMLVVML